MGPEKSYELIKNWLMSGGTDNKPMYELWLSDMCATCEQCPPDVSNAAFEELLMLLKDRPDTYREQTEETLRTKLFDCDDKKWKCLERCWKESLQYVGFENG